MDNEKTYKGFQDLESWKQARILRIKVSAITKTFPKEERYELCSQILSASRSITNNIAEGYGRFTYTDTRHFFIQARGSATETIDQLIIAFDENYITQMILKELVDLTNHVIKLINGYIFYLDSQKKQTQRSNNS